MSETPATVQSVSRVAAHVLVADDSSTVLEIVRAALQTRGYRVTTCDESRAVLDRALADPPDLILLDFVMPEANAYDICTELGQRPEVESIPIVLMLTRGDPVGDRFVRDLGVLDYITKPFAPDALLALVDHILAKGLDEAPIRGRAELVVRDTPLLMPNKAERPSLTGDLAQVPVAEVMQMLALQRQTGVLAVRHTPSAVAIAFLRGTVRLVSGQGMPPHLRLGAILVQDGLLTAAELEAQLNAAPSPAKRLGQLLVSRGQVARAGLIQSLRRQSAELVYEMLRWSVGKFSFARSATLPQEATEFDFALSVDELLMEGYRRVDEWGLIESVLPDFSAVVAAVPGAGAHEGAARLDPAEVEVLAALDGRRDVHAVIAAVQRPPFDVARILYRLLAARLATVVGQGAEPDHAPPT